MKRSLWNHLPGNIGISIMEQVFFLSGRFFGGQETSLWKSVRCDEGIGSESFPRLSDWSHAPWMDGYRCILRSDGTRITWICLALTIVGPQKWLFWGPGPLLYMLIHLLIGGSLLIDFLYRSYHGIHHHQIVTISLHFQTPGEEVFGPQKHI